MLNEQIVELIGSLTISISKVMKQSSLQLHWRPHSTGIDVLSVRYKSRFEACGDSNEMTA